MAEKYGFVMLIKEKWWQEFCRRHHLGKEVHSYVRTGATSPMQASLIFFYVTKPTGKMMGYADFIERKVGGADQMWKNYGHESAISSKEKYREFLGDEQQVTFIRFKNMHETVRPVPLNDILMLLSVKRMGRKGFFISKDISEKLVSFME